MNCLYCNKELTSIQQFSPDHTSENYSGICYNCLPINNCIIYFIEKKTDKIESIIYCISSNEKKYYLNLNFKYGVTTLNVNNEVIKFFDYILECSPSNAEHKIKSILLLL